jgi:hypothetical protein
MSELIRGAFWAAVGERAAKTFCQTLAVTLGAGAFDVLTVPWQAALSMSAGATLVSVLMSISSAGLTGGGPSLNNAEKVTA